jgi:hypothetical protein
MLSNKGRRRSAVPAAVAVVVLPAVAAVPEVAVVEDGDEQADP